MDSATFVVLAAAVLLAFVALTAATTYHHARRDILHPIVLVNGIITFFVLIPAAWLLATRLQAFPNYIDIAHPARSLAIALAALGGMYIVILGAYRYAGRVSVTGSLTTAGDDALADVNPRVVLALGVVGFIVGVVNYAVFVYLNGGIIRMFTVTPRTAFYHVPNTLRYQMIGMLGVFGGFATILCALRPAIERSRVRRHNPTGFVRSIRVAVAIALVTAITLAVAVSTRARMVILVPLAMLIVYVHTAGWLSRRTVVGVGGFVVAAGLSFSLIESVLLGQRVDVALSTLLHSVVHMPRFALMMVLVESVPGEVGYQWGATLPKAFYLDLPGFPRYGNLLERIATGTDSKNISFSAMLPGELWLNFGPVGLAVGGVVYGVALRWTYRLRTSASVLVRGAQPTVFVCVLLLWPTNLTWGIPNLFIRFLVPVAIAIGVAVVVQRRFPSLARTLGARIGDE